MKARLICAFDPVCGWCFGFRPSLRALRHVIGDKVEWSIASAGLVTGENEKPIRELAPALQKGMSVVERRSGVRFGSAFREGLLNDARWVLSSEPSCRAMFVAAELFGEKVFEFADLLITAFYEDGQKPSDPETIRGCAEDAELDADALIAAWNSPDAAQSTKAMFALWKHRGIAVYPAVFIERNGELERVFEGYLDPDVAVERTLAVL